MSSSHAFPTRRRAALRLALFAATAAAALTAATAASATVVFSDEFNDDASGVPVTSLVHWNLLQGNVDVLPHNGNFPCGTGAVGNCLDMDGSNANAPAVIETKSSFIFVAGEEYELAFDFRTGTGTDAFTVTVGDFFLEMFPSGSYSFPFEVTRSFTIGADGAAPIRFAMGPTLNNMGPYLDTVTLTRTADAKVPAPAALGLFGLGLLGLGALARRKPSRRPA